MIEYDEIKKYMKRFDDNSFFNTYSSADLFLNIFHNKKRYIFSFINNFLEISVGIQLFLNNNGFNYVHDILTLNGDNMIVAGKMDSLCAVYLDKEYLTKDDIDYIHNMGYRIKKEKNLVIFRYELGYMKRYANKKELNELLENIEFIYSFVKDDNNFIDSMSAFETERMPISFIDNKRLEYTTTFLPIPNLSVMPRKLPVNNQVVEEFKNIQFTGETCYMFCAYTPLIIQETGVRPLLLYFYFQERNKVVFKYITDSPKEYKNYIFGILDDVFNKEGLPEKIYMNDRSFYSYLAKTLKELNIEYELLLEDNDVDLNILNAVEKLYRNSEELYKESKDGIEMVLELIISELNSLSEMISEEEEYEKEKEKIVV